MPLKEGHEFKDKKVSGELHLRLRWLPNSAGLVDAAFDAGISVNMSLAGFGISLIEASATKLPRELMHVLLDEISMEYERRGPDESARLRLKSMQIDNQLMTSLHPVVFAHSRMAVDVKNQPPPSDDTPQVSHVKPVLEVRLEKLNTNPRLLHIRYFTFLLQEIDLVLEEDFLDLLMQWFEDLPLEKLKFTFDEKGRRKTMTEIERFLHRLMESRDLSTEFTASSRRGERCYFEVLHIQPIKVNVTLLASPAIAMENHSKRYRTASALGINLMDLTNVPFKINAMIMKNAFMRPREMMTQVVRHIKWQVLLTSTKGLAHISLFLSPGALRSA